MKADRVTSLFWLAVGLVAMWGASRLGLGEFRQPGPGLFPFLAGLFVSSMAVLVFCVSLFARSESPAPELSLLWAEVDWRRPALVILFSIGYIVFLERTGFVLTSLIFLVLLLRTTKTSWRKAAVIALLAVLGSYSLFELLLRQRFPKGTWMLKLMALWGL